MNSNLKLQKELLSPPGDTIQETINYIGMSHDEFAGQMGWTIERLNDILKGREPITLEIALLLDLILEIPANFWLEREKEYRIELASIEQQESSD